MAIGIIIENKSQKPFHIQWSEDDKPYKNSIYFVYGTERTGSLYLSTFRNDYGRLKLKAGSTDTLEFVFDTEDLLKYYSNSEISVEEKIKKTATKGELIIITEEQDTLHFEKAEDFVFRYEEYPRPFY